MDNKSDDPIIWNPRKEPERARTLNLKNPIIEMFPEELTDLHKEIHHHPKLLALLHGQPDKDVYIQILEIAAYCDIFVMGTYTRDDMLELCKKLTRKLQSSRTLVVVPF